MENNIYNNNAIISDQEFVDMIEKKDMEFKNELLNNIKCKACNLIMLDPTFCFTCNKNICSKCHKDCSNLNLKNSRHLKTFLQNFLFKCKNSAKGCLSKLNYFDFQEHFEKCEFKQGDGKAINNLNLINLNNSNNRINLINNNDNDQKIISFADYKCNINNFDVHSNLYLYNLQNIKNSRSSSNNNINDIKDSLIDNAKAKASQSSSSSYLNNKDVKNSDSKIICTECNDEFVFKSIEELIAHRNSDNCKNKDFFNINNLTNDNNNQNGLEYTNNKKFLKGYEILKDRFARNITETYSKNLEIFKKFFADYNTDIENKNNLIAKLMNTHQELKQIEKQTDDQLIQILEKDPEYINIMNIRTQLLKRKNELEIELSKRINEINRIKAESELKFESIKFQYLKKIENLEKIECELNRAIDKIQPGLLPSMNTRNIHACGVCSNESSQVKKVICEDCKMSFCENKCIKLCVGEACKGPNKKYVCPNHISSCGLCGKNSYCDVCQKKCYYINCKNQFCPTCFRRNEHQIRNPNISCRFFTCERDQHSDCIMCSIFCQKCEKRLCKNCIRTEIDHFPFLKN